MSQQNNEIDVNRILQDMNQLNSIEMGNADNTADTKNADNKKKGKQKPEYRSTRWFKMYRLSGFILMILGLGGGIASSWMISNGYGDLLNLVIGLAVIGLLQILWFIVGRGEKTNKQIEKMKRKRSRKQDKSVSKKQKKRDKLDKQLSSGSDNRNSSLNNSSTNTGSSSGLSFDYSKYQ